MTETAESVDFDTEVYKMWILANMYHRLKFRLKNGSTVWEQYSFLRRILKSCYLAKRFPEYLEKRKAAAQIQLRSLPPVDVLKRNFMTKPPVDYYVDSETDFEFDLKLVSADRDDKDPLKELYRYHEK